MNVLRYLPGALLALLLAVTAACDERGSSLDAENAPSSDERVDSRTVSQTVQFKRDTSILDYATTDVLGHKDSLHLAETFGNRESFGRIHDLLTFDEFVVIADQLMDPHLAVLDRVSGKLIHRFGPDGAGPGEFRDVSRLFKISSSPPVAAAYDVPNQRITYIRFEGDEYEPILLEDVPFRGGGLTIQMAPHRTGYVGIGGYGADYRLLTVDSIGQPLRRIQTETPEVVTSAARKTGGDRTLLQSTMALHPNGSHVALAFLHLNRLELVNLADETYRVVRGPESVKTNFTIREAQGFRMDFPNEEKAYFAVAATRRHVYVAFCGCVHLPQAEKYPYPRQIQVYSWDGQFVGQLDLDQQVSKIAVPEGDSVLYASYRTPVPWLGKWELPDWLSSR